MPPNSSSATVVADEDTSSSPLESSAPPFSVGEILSDYKLLSILGQGSFGTVYLAEEMSLGRQVALKVCSNDVLEGRTIAQLNHEGIIRVHSQTTHQGFSLINMQFVPSLTLEAVFAQLSLPESQFSGHSLLQILGKDFSESLALTVSEYRNREKVIQSSFPQTVAWLGLQMAEALSHAHERGILHLDIKPANILIHPSGKPYLMDFNVSVSSDSLQSGVPENFGGTFEYMAPEQMAVFFSRDRNNAIKAVGEASDVYALGMVLKKFLALSPELSQTKSALEAILLRATQKDVSLRFLSAKALMVRLEGFLEATEIRKSLPQGGLLGVWKKHPLLGLTLVGAVPQTVAAVVGYLYNCSQVVSRLDVTQQQVFQQLNVIYGAVTGFLGLVIWGGVLMKLHRCLKSQGTGEESQFRRFVLRIPLWGIVVSSLSWLPGVVLFPYVLHSAGGGIVHETWFHLTCSFLLSYLIALSYSFVVHCFIVATAVYPRFWWSETFIRQKSRIELTPFLRRLEAFSLVTILVPLLSVLIFLYRSQEVLEPGQFLVFRFLMALLISPGTAGVWFAVLATEQVRNVVRQFTTPKGAR